MAKPMVHLHAHSEYSILDGQSRTKDMAKRAAELGHPAIAITDHGVMGGCLEFYMNCRKAGVKPLIGMEAYIAPFGTSRKERIAYQKRELEGKPGFTRNNYHLIVIAKDKLGYENLCALSTESYATGYYYKPRIDYELLKEHHEGLIVSSACFTAGHKVIVRAREGWRWQNIEDIKAGQFVLTHHRRWRRVLSPTTREYTGMGYVIHTDHQGFDNHDITCTANHQFLKYLPDSNSTAWVAAEDLQQGDLLMEPLVKKVVYKQSNNRLLRFLKCQSINDELTQLFPTCRSKGYTCDIEISNSIMMLFGLWLADGSISLTDKTQNVTLAFNSDEYDVFMNGFVREALAELQTHCSIRHRAEQHRVDLVIYDKKIIALFHMLFGLAHAEDKQVPHRLMHINKALDIALLYGYLLGDGHFHFLSTADGGQVISVSISEKLSRDIYELWEWLGFSPSIELHHAYTDKHGTTHRQSWFLKVNNTVLAENLQKTTILSIAHLQRLCEAAQLWGNHKKATIVTVGADRFRLKRIKHIASQPLATRVYCLNVDEDHSFVCEGVSVHNCILGEVQNHLWCGDWEKAKEVALFLREVFGDDFYLEGMNHHLDMEIIALRRLRELSKELDIPIVATNDSHYIKREDSFTYNFMGQEREVRFDDHKLQRTLMLLGMHKTWEDPDVSGSFWDLEEDNAQRMVEDKDAGDSDPIFMTPPDLYIKDYDEMMEVLCLEPGDREEAERELDITLEIAEKCNCELDLVTPGDLSSYHMPQFDFKNDVHYDEFMESDFQTPQHTKDAIVAQGKAIGKGGDTVEEMFTEHEVESLRFVSWLCDRGMKRLIEPKIQHLGEPLPDDTWIQNPPSGFVVEHRHNSPDETWIKGELAKGKTADDLMQMYWDRLDEELSVVLPKGFIDYFAIVQDYCNYTRFRNAQIGPARGSGAGSLLNYLIGITSVDPIPNKLLFSRFISLDRIDYPDIDLDWSKTFRDNDLWPHLRDEYGMDSSSAVATYTFFWGKAAVKAAGRVLFANGYDAIQRAIDLTDLLDNAPKLDLRNELDGSNEPFCQLVASDPKYRQIVEMALLLQGRVSATSQHASAFILSPFPITNKMPLMVSKEEREKSQKTGQPVTNYLIQFDGYSVQDQLGYVKLDLLCVKDLEVIQKSMETIERIYGTKIDIEAIPLDMGGPLDMVKAGNVAGIFQFDSSPVARRLLMDSQADCITDWSNVNACNRPGPLQMGYDQDLIRGKLHPETISYFTPAAEQYLKDSYGVALTQESLMLMVQDPRICGVDASEADHMRKILAKKKKDKLEGLMRDLHEMAAKNNVPIKIIDDFCDIATAAGSYSFNACLTGDTMLWRAGRSHHDKQFPGYEISIEEVYRRFNAPAFRGSKTAPIRRKYRSKQPNIGLFVICRDADGRARKHKVKNVVQSGEQQVWLITLANGKTVKATGNHRFQVGDESYLRVDQLAVGMSLWCCDFVYDVSTSRSYNFSDVHDIDGSHTKGIAYPESHRGFLSGRANPSYTGGGFTKFKTYHDAFDGICEQCHRQLADGERYETHHIDGDRNNNEESNLINLCVSCHKKMDYALGRCKRGQKGYETYTSEIVSITPAGIEMTYDIEIESDEHNFFANGICSHNSHSFAYALIAYRGATIKYYFPDAFFAALAQIKPMQKGKDRIADFMREAQQMGVTVKPPHVNYSEVEFDVPERGVIAYGLNRIKGVGKAAEPIVQERRKNGPFKDFSDFMTRVPREVGKSALLPLIHYGALDGLGWSRKAMEESIDDVIAFRKSYFDSKRKRAALALDLFAMDDAASEADSSVELVPPFDTEYNDRQMLELEKQFLGMYMSGSPEAYKKLTRFSIEQQAQRTWDAAVSAQKNIPVELRKDMPPRPVNVGDIKTLPDKTLVEFVCMVSDGSKNRPNPRTFPSGKGCSIQVQDWGKKEESQYGFSPVIYTTRLTMFSRLMATTPLPRSGDMIHVVGRVNIDATGQWPPAVLLDSLEILHDDIVLMKEMPRDALMQLQQAYQNHVSKISDPSSDAYMVPVMMFPSRSKMNEFLEAVSTRRFFGEGHAVLTFPDDKSGGLVRSLKQTVGMVRHAQSFGASVKKMRLPAASAALMRQKITGKIA